MSKFILDAQGGQMHGDIRTQDVTVSGGPTLLPADELKSRKEFSLHNGSGASIWLGGSDVTQHNGMPLADAASFKSKLGRAQLYATTAGPTVSGVRIMEIA
jgi:hypothetical protein